MAYLFQYYANYFKLRYRIKINPARKDVKSQLPILTKPSVGELKLEHSYERVVVFIELYREKSSQVLFSVTNSSYESN